MGVGESAPGSIGRLVNDQLAVGMVGMESPSNIRELNIDQLAVRMGHTGCSGVPIVACARVSSPDPDGLFSAPTSVGACTCRHEGSVRAAAAFPFETAFTSEAILSAIPREAHHRDGPATTRA